MYNDIESEDNRIGLLFILVCETSIIQTSCYSNRIHSFLPVLPIIIKWNGSGYTNMKYSSSNLASFLSL